MDLRHLEVFHAIMRTGSVTGAARLLNVSQPAVSSVLKHLEARTRIRLFTRAGGRLHPTPEAIAIFPDIASIYGRLDAVGRLVYDLSAGRLGSLSVAGAFPIANGYLAKAVASFIKARPGTRVTLQSMTSPQVVERVASGEVELGVAYEPVVHSEVETEVLMSTGVSCVMREDHPLAERREIAVRELEAHSIITYLPQNLLRGYVDRHLSEAGIAPRIAVEISVSLTGMTLAYYGAGVALVEPYLLSTMPVPGLVARPLKPRIELKTLLVRARAGSRSAIMDRFVPHLRDTVAALSSAA
jgi:DNA-binding transcriptional LysR family regulator